MTPHSPPAVRVRLLAEEDLDELLAFERDNRAWFERWVPARPPDYFEPEGLRRIVGSLLADQERGTSRFYVVHSGEGALIGRVNLVRRGGPRSHTARLGYRVAEAVAGRGVATRAVELVLRDVFANWGVSRIEASTILGNVGSERVLERNGFELVGRQPGGLSLHGRPVDRLDYTLESPLAQRMGEAPASS